MSTRLVSGGNFVLEAFARGVKVINLDKLTCAGNLTTLSSLACVHERFTWPQVLREYEELLTRWYPTK